MAQEAVSRTLAVYDLLRKEIIFGRLAPGEKLRINELVQRYGYGQTPVREALSRLAAERFVQSQSQRGFKVMEISSEDLAEINALRLHLESLALDQATEKGGADWEAEIVAAHYRLSRCKPPRVGDSIKATEEWERHHTAFHNALLASGGQGWLHLFLDRISAQTERYRRFILMQEGFDRLDPKHPLLQTLDRELEYNLGADPHADLMRAVLDRKRDKAQSLLKLHVAQMSHLFERILPEILQQKAAANSGLKQV